MIKMSDYIKIGQAAKLLGVSPSTLRNWEKENKIAVYRHSISNFRMYKISDLEDILNKIRTD